VTIGAKVSGMTFTDTTAAIGQTHYYKVTAVDGEGNESLATPVSFQRAVSGRSSRKLPLFPWMEERRFLLI